MKSRSCVVHFDGIHLATVFFRSACHWRFGLKNYILAAKWRCPAPGVPVGGCHERWARPGRPYYPPACSKMPRSILLVFDLDGVSCTGEGRYLEPIHGLGHNVRNSSLLALALAGGLGYATRTRATASGRQSDTVLAGRYVY